MNKKLKFVASILVALSSVLILTAIVHGHTFAILQPSGTIAHSQRHLMIIASLMTLIVVVPVFVMTLVIVWKYRVGRTGSKYTPDWDGNKILETIWWGVPSVLILILGIITWKSSHELDPFKPIVSDVPPITIQVVALPWKWLFIYPDQHIATVNYVQFPKDTPVNFEVTADAPMNSFWIPQLGGQIYAMAGMSTQLHLMADQVGSYDGSSANLSGRGFAGMKFVAKSSSLYDFNTWVQSVKHSSSRLDQIAYDRLAAPSENNAVAYYAANDDSLYNEVMRKYMAPGAHSDMTAMPGMPMDSYGSAKP